LGSESDRSDEIATDMGQDKGRPGFINVIGYVLKLEGLSSYFKICKEYGVVDMAHGI
jgi:hypothetical protein